jgi:catechol 2,3-dioxygenase-like lactoylglutathione lyase family enzyme
MNHVSFTVSDLGQSVAFYTDVLGLELMDRAGRDAEFSEAVTGVPGAELEIAYIKGPGDCNLELIQYLTPQGEKLPTSMHHVGRAHICFVVTEFKQELARLRELGVNFVSKDNCIVPAGPNKGKGVVYFHDPDGYTIEFFSEEIL